MTQGGIIRKQTRLWKTKVGIKVRVCDMGDQHLLNTISLLKRVAAMDQQRNLQAAYSASCYLIGEIASDECDRAISQMEEDPDGEENLPEIYFAMLEDAQRRGLKL
jgi:hypothetical protein